jgi:hypothetical protein
VTVKVDHDERRTAIWRLQRTLTGHDMIAEAAPSAPLLVVAGRFGEGTRMISVRCAPRPTDGGALWFWSDRGQGLDAKPLSPADRTADAVRAILDERILRM